MAIPSRNSDESGHEDRHGIGAIDLSEWVFMLAPAKVSKELIMRLNTELAKTLSGADVREKLETGGFEAAPSTPQQLDTMIGEALDRWFILIPELRIKPE
jgi:tripartite-type tricarboxylate transporter receptor subunit TctC